MDSPSESSPAAQGSTPNKPASPPPPSRTNATNASTPDSSRPSSRRSTRSKSSLTLDLSSLPPYSPPSQPSNTLLFTNLSSPSVFAPDNLITLRDLISQTAPIHSWSPLRSFRRIVVSFANEEAAIAVRAVWDGESVLGDRVRVYFGAPTPTGDRPDEHLALPDAGKLFFISPPPSPPCDWEMKLEDAPNKKVHAEDLAEALSKLRHQAGPSDEMAWSPVANSPSSAVEESKTGNGDAGQATSAQQQRTGRSRSSTLIYQPADHGHSPDLPAISVEDMTDFPVEWSPIEDKAAKVPVTHTARPPLELMEGA